MPPTPVLASSRAQGFHLDPLEEPPSRIVCTGRRRSEPPHMEQAAPARSDLSGGHNQHGADPTTRPFMPPSPIRGQMMCRRRPGCRRRTPPRSPRQGRLPHPTIVALGRGSRRAAAGRQARRAARPDRPCHPRRGAPHRPHDAGKREDPRHRHQPRAKAGGVLRRRREGRTDGEPRRLGF